MLSCREEEEQSRKRSRAESGTVRVRVLPRVGEEMRVPLYLVILAGGVIIAAIILSSCYQRYRSVPVDR